MNYQKSTRYGLYAALELATRPSTTLVTANEVAAKYHLPPALVAKAFQRLVRAGIAVGIRGMTGGYRLARSGSEITVLDVITAFESPRSAGECLLASCPANPCSHSATCRLRRLFDEVNEQARATFASVSLETLAAPRQPLSLAANIGRR